MTTMRVWLGVVAIALVTGPALGQEKEQDRVENAGKVMQKITNIPDNIPSSVLDKADCVVVLPSVVKFAIGIGGSYGRGVMTCRGGENFDGRWGAPIMMAVEGGSFGLQLGGQATDFVLLLMSPRSAENILTSKVKLGGDASAAAGPVEETLPPKLTQPCGPRSFPTPALADCLQACRSRVQLSGRTTMPTKSYMEKR